MRLRDEELLVYEQISKGRRSSHPGGTPSGRERHRTCPRLTSKPWTPSMVVEIIDEQQWDAGIEN